MCEKKCLWCKKGSEVLFKRRGSAAEAATAIDTGNIQHSLNEYQNNTIKAKYP